MAYKSPPKLKELMAFVVKRVSSLFTPAMPTMIRLDMGLFAQIYQGAGQRQALIEGHQVQIYDDIAPQEGDIVVRNSAIAVS